MQVPLSSIVSELFREFRLRKWSILLLFISISTLVLIVGFTWKANYSSSVTIFIDNQNIIRPLMAGSAVTTKVNNQISSAREMIYSRNVLMKLVETDDIWRSEYVDTDRKKEELVVRIRKKIKVKGKGSNYFSITYTDSNPLTAFRVAQKLGQYFIAENEANKKKESQSAYSFVDKQVKSYQEQLRLSEEKLKVFLSENVDGTEASIMQRVSNLRGQIEQSELELKELATQRASNQAQLRGVNKTIRREAAGVGYSQRIAMLQTKLDDLRLSFHDSYPDIVSLKQQIAELETARDHMLQDNEQATGDSNQGILLNPLYQELRSELGKTETSIRTVTTRIESLNNLLASSLKRMERIQSNKVKTAELTRDNEVNRGIYNDLLKKREQARVSMHLDIEGQGLSYQIHEPAEYPLAPIGLKFLHFAAVGLLAGAIAPLALIIVLLNVDPRVRVGSVFHQNTGIAVLATVSNFMTPAEQRKHNFSRVIFVISALIAVSVYLLVVYLKLKGMI